VTGWRLLAHRVKYDERDVDALAVARRSASGSGGGSGGVSQLVLVILYI